MGSSDQSGAATTVGVRVAAEYEQLTMLRALTETVLLIAELTLDEVTDIQVAIDEIATGLIDTAIGGSTIECDFVFHDGRIAVCITAIAATREIIDQEGFGWHVIRTITDSFEADVGTFDQVAGGYPVTVEFGRAGGRFRR
ncbi:ATP-binding protein [Nocardia sp. NEAU-G5]|uniref:ATP-binding protein n=1 Tax=Nocardia albiluteola TaxID=2842303 RepID=A0ABS6B6S5_9NOCA|nr:ATP-binding protein [Nocardia albiluteola]MBU3066002.1 ATP-binding protein [Nocardia albiluteola]